MRTCQPMNACGDATLPRTLLFMATAIFVFASSPIVFPASAAETTSVWQGVYTKDQAARGKTRYFTACAACHGGLLQGDSDSPELAGVGFMKRWGEQSIATLFAFANSQMPVGRPGSLGAQGYADVIAFILESNGFPAGDRELPANEQALESIVIERKQ
jgi:mono/diheme cytochrome c family protein